MRIDNEEDDYSSEDDYLDNEKTLLKKFRNQKSEYSDEEEQVFGVGPDDDSEDDNEGSGDDQSDLALSDVEGQNDDDDLPDVRAWGKDKRKFYQTDYVDQDYGGFQGKDAHLADLEEEEARNLQKQLAEQLDDDDFALDIFSKSTKEDEKHQEEIIKTDVSKLTKRQKLEIIQKESPEFFSLVEDFQAKMLTAKNFLLPILRKAKNNEIPQSNAVDFVQTKYELILNYCTNIYMYMLLKVSKTNIQNHPLIKRLYQYRQLLLQLEPIFEEIVKPQIELMLSEDKQDENVKVKSKKKTLKLLTKLQNQNEVSLKRKKDDNLQPERVKKVKFEDEIPATDKSKKTLTEIKQSDSSEGEEDLVQNEEIVQDSVEGEPSKRAITYEMAKNKGLTPHRKKEQRNPRVKHRLKYRKALIRRKGAVREPRKELSRYSGEISGIKATVSRSIKIKT
ncbi:unnamed protein product [Phyllotreta striolata]|uniref:Sas10 C-terminal domain-containing protein n=1 Tax=Phyllotreta striolata TaxID=444603 RepID=A0A9N9XLY9_PHYSR|nr:unnamed protein product [Phyllotreta striolata]